MRRPASVLTALVAVIGTTSMAGPVLAEPAPPCALPRTDAHHSLGLDTWNDAYVRPRKTVDAVMVFLSFPDSRPLTTPAQLADDHFPATADFFRSASYGRLDLRAHPLDEWIEMPSASRSYDIARDWNAGMRSAFVDDALAAADPEVDFSRYDVVYLVADPHAPGVDSDATKVVNFHQPVKKDGTELRRVVTVFEQYPADRNVLAHETGHVFDLPDLYNRPEDGKGDWDTHVGDWDLMGSQFGLAPDPFGWHKWKMGWLDDARVDCVQAPGTTRHTLQPLAEPAARPGADTRLLAVRTGPHEVIAVEAREPVGNDIALCTAGLLVYRVRSDTASAGGPVEVLDAHPGSGACHGSSVHPELADAPLGEGETLLAADGAVAVTAVRRAESGAWTVRVTRR
ncbi:M6 family metalloprotease domain-containing protein [Streptomyces sp. 549]|uniref:M6 family metalloprotease domain-containing protein n=1 Tax=Streptomyces sp. 549 TaxID=3049076 RepID=UPI0024C46641|nr:M6 family metalloprotease domain-containing protein [Streptomyces sp. 549]MDK1473724.1 M6 family metalloprotease domain-containing protein [Streptomyces sp. 549]